MCENTFKEKEREREKTERKKENIECVVFLLSNKKATQILSINRLDFHRKKTCLMFHTIILATTTVAN
jgi:hypothetical protein